MSIADFPWGLWWFGAFFAAAMGGYGWRDGGLIVFIMCIPAVIFIALCY